MLTKPVAEKIPAVITLHDVMPGRLDEIEYCLGRLDEAGIQQCYLLVVPGRSWSVADHRRLITWADKGHILVAHGWYHQAKTVSGLYHKLHSLVLSKDVAEHMALAEDEVIGLMQRSRDWFDSHGYPSPDYYVPPAWALGKISAGRLGETGFTYVETTSSIFHLPSRQRRRLPLLGFETDHRLQAHLLGLSNLVNLQLTKLMSYISLGTPVIRFSLHPADYKLLLAPTIDRYLSQLQPILLTDQLLFGDVSGVRAQGSTRLGT